MTCSTAPLREFLVPRIFNTGILAYAWHIYSVNDVSAVYIRLQLVERSEEASPINDSRSFLLPIIVSSVTSLIFFGPYKYEYRVYQQTLLKRNTRFSTVQIREAYFFFSGRFASGTLL
jgi:hypothetical protein